MENNISFEERLSTQRVLFEALQTEQRGDEGGCKKSDDAVAPLNILSLLSIIPDGVILSTEDFKILEVNDEAVRIIGVPGKELIGRNVLDCIPSIGKRAPGEQSDSSSYTETGCATEGRAERLIEYRAVPFHDGERHYLVIIFRDIVGRYQMIEDLRKATARAEFGVRARSHFLGAMSHELRTPLNAIIGFSDMILADAEGILPLSQWMGYIQDIRSSGRSMLTMIEDILEIAQFESGTPSLEFADRADLAVIAAQEIEFLGEMARAKDVAIEIECGGKAMMDKCDRIALSQALRNVIQFAILMSPRGETVRVNLFANEVLNVNVTDNGQQVESDEGIFTPFCDQSHLHVGDGPLGFVGLSIAKRLIEGHGGVIDYGPHSLGGNICSISLPKTQ